MVLRFDEHIDFRPQIRETNMILMAAVTSQSELSFIFKVWLIAVLPPVSVILQRDKWIVGVVLSLRGTALLHPVERKYVLSGVIK
jgi:hypothetical protein